MYELIPLSVGLVLGTLLLQVRSSRQRVGIGVGLSLAVGVAVSAIAGELGESPLFTLWDAFQCGAAACVAIVAVPRVGRRRA